MVSTLERPLCQSYGADEEKDEMVRFFGIFHPKQVFQKARSYEADTMSMRRQWTKRSQRSQKSSSFQSAESGSGVSTFHIVLRAMLCLILHFMLLMIALISAAVIFSHVEDETEWHTPGSNQSNVRNFAERWNRLELKYNVTFTQEDKSLFAINTGLNTGTIEKSSNSQSYNYKKWFYFASMVSTTIGYGDVFPKTESGRLVFIIFSIISIPLMLSFIASCGDKIRVMHTSFLSALRQCVTGQQGGAPEDLLSCLLITISFVGHTSVGCALISGQHNWSLVDKIYYHVSMFTTTGLGDIIEPLDQQIDNVVPLFFYHIFGLALLFAAIKSFYCWYQSHQEALAVLRLTQRPLKARGRVTEFLPCCRPKLREEPRVESTMLI
ncbi:potassium channel subfamily K member 15-like [Clytia hemisphaerica]|uniref:Potassium channel domain-containing protein n=1 Tax=Clytia hemisphaerica TaxID=252671 RepID=A0A7M5XMI1_9CNID|eukprot:TCONS_00008632-protein